MFDFFKKKVKPRNVDLSALVADMHSHLIPGIDDGAKTMEDSLALIQGLHELGYRKLITTPHVMSEIYPNSTQTISDGLAKLRTELQRQPWQLEIDAAAEYYLDDIFDEQLRNGAQLLPISKNMVLVEFSFVTTPLNLKDTLFQIQVNGYKPVLAHPERYLYFARNRSQYDELKGLGYLFQLNLLSLTGYYGKLPMDLAQHLVAKGYVDLLGTDMHHLRHLDTLRSAGFIMDVVDKLMDTGKILNPTL